MKDFFVSIWQRVFLSYRSTGLGLLVTVGVYAVTYASTAGDVPNWMHLIAGLVLTPFLAWRDRKVADGTIKILACILGVGLLSSCSLAKNAAADVKTCAGQTLTAIEAAGLQQLQPEVDAALRLDWTAALAELTAMAAKYGSGFIDCMVAELHSQYMLIASGGSTYQGPAPSTVVAKATLANGPQSTLKAAVNAQKWLGR